MKRVDVPVVDQLLVGVDIDREVEEVRDERHELAVLRQFARLQHVQPLEDQDVRPVDGDDTRRAPRHRSGANRPARGRSAGPALMRRQEAQQRADVVAVGKALALHQVLAAQHLVGKRKPSVVTRSTFGLDGQRGSSSFSTRAVVDLPTATEPAMPMMKGVLTAFGGVEEALALAEQQLARLDMRREQARQRQVDAPHLVEIDRVVERAQPAHLVARSASAACRRGTPPIRSADEEAVGRVVLGRRQAGPSHIAPVARRRRHVAATPSRRGPTAPCAARVRPARLTAARRRAPARQAVIEQVGAFGDERLRGRP